MAAPCANCPPLRKQNRNASIHLKPAIKEGWGHAYSDKRPVGIQAVSEGRRNYQESQQHKEAYAVFDEDKTCWPAAHGAPKECAGPITPSHSLARSKAGGLENADKYPVPPACARHNAGQQDDTEISEWAEVTYFTWKDGQQYPFKITDAWLQAERARSIRL
jgi:hypothetical protein